ncbi:MAG: SDR family NAD(P)-dependent oxidoreductase [Dehalococcoidia bacterium]
MQDFEGKVAVVTGGASGIGLGLATRFAEEGMKVVLADVEAPALEAAVTKLRQQEHDVLGVLTDVSIAESVEDLARKALEAYGKVHVLCNNAGVGGGRGPIWQSSFNDWQWVFGVNFWGVLHGIRTFVPIMLGHGEEGHVVNTASMAGLVSGAGIYGVTKHAVVSLSESLYLHLQMAQAKLGASVLCPGFVSTNIADAERNRPAELQNESGAPLSEFEQAIRDRMRGQISGGMPPEQVAGIVVEAIRAGQFWITTTDEFDEIVRTRMEGILERRNPELRLLG